jgi:hypothetical protein
MEPVEYLQAQITLLDRRLQMISEELTHALERIAPKPGEEQETDQDRKAPVSDKIEFNADGLSQFVRGFYQREYDNASQVFRWTGDGPLVEFRFLLDRSDDRPFRIDMGTTRDGVLNALTGYVDYAQIPLTVEKKRARRFVTGVIPKRACTRLVVMTFLLGAMPRDKKHKDAEPQWLGFQFYSFQAG